MREFEYSSRQGVAAPVEVVFAYLSDVRNLNELTPSFMRFEIVSPLPVEMRVGTRIEYGLRFRGLRFRWQNEITVWNPPSRFAYEQRNGPFRRWSHEHWFEGKSPGSVTCDRVVWAANGGQALRRLWVDPNVRRIFVHRNRILEKRFGPLESSP